MKMIDVVEEYYDKCTKYYSWFWYDKESLGLHYGFWDKDTKNRKEVLINQYREIIKLLEPKSNELVLDIGCGVGGASIWLARKTNARFIGITISSKQVELAKKYSVKYGVSDGVGFYKMDYFRMGFKEEIFDKIFGIESFCYSYPNPESFLQEMYRVLKNSGKLPLSDGILLRYPKNNQEQELFEKFCLGWKLNGGNTLDEINNAFKKAGFKNIRFFNKTDVIKRNVSPIHMKGVIAYPILKTLHFLKLISQVELENVLGVIIQKKLVDLGLMGYGVFCAQK